MQSTYRHASAAPTPPPPKQTVPAPRRRRIPFLQVWLGLSLIVPTLVAVGIFMWNRNQGFLGIKKSSYQAVFLVNNQVYFGKIVSSDSNRVKMEDVYYIQASGSLQTGDNSNTQTQFTLTKLGSELHGPEDVLNIERKQVIFWENLRDDSKVVQTIKNSNK